MFQKTFFSILTLKCFLLVDLEAFYVHSGYGLCVSDEMCLISKGLVCNGQNCVCRQVCIYF